MTGDAVIGIAQTNREPRVFAHTAGLGISIAREWRGLGLGRRLMQILLSESERLIPGLEMIQLGCFASNVRAISLYTSLGFVECGRVPGKIRLRESYVDEVIMARPVVGRS